MSRLLYFFLPLILLCGCGETCTYQISPPTKVHYIIERQGETILEGDSSNTGYFKYTSFGNETILIYPYDSKYEPVISYPSPFFKNNPIVLRRKPNVN